MKHESIARAAARDLSVMELIQNADALRAEGDMAAVLELYDTFVTHNGDHPLLYAVLFNMGVTLTDTGDVQRARQALERAIEIKPDFHPAHINLGRLYERLGGQDLAVAQWTKMAMLLSQVTGSAITHKTMALNQMARVLESAHSDAAAEETLRQSLEIDPNQREAAQHLIAARQRQCVWPVIAPFERMTREALLKGISPLSICAYTDDPMLQLAISWLYNLQDVGAPDHVMTGHWAATSRKDGRLRIGYLSSDLREHAIGHLMYEVLALHDREKVEVFAYYCGIRTDDPIHRQYKGDADHFVDIGEMDDAQGARRIADDGIQILVDVNGYTRDGRTKLLAMRPAPVIVNWLGFPGTTGSPYHHYIVADNWIIPAENELYYSEAVRRLPCYQPNNRQRIVADHRPTRTEAGLPEDAFVYCCFNGTHKITRPTFERWLAILQRVPGSVLWLLSGAEPSHDRLKTYTKVKGIDPARVIFADKLANPYHLARYSLADLFLDTTPYGAHTTCSDALWMGVPVLTYSGRSFASRVCGSLVRSAGLADLVCSTAESYVDQAVAIGRDPGRLADLKARLAGVRAGSVLFDTPKLVTSLEDLYAGMWRDCESGNLPQPDLLNLETYLEIGLAFDHDAVEVQTVSDYRGLWRERLAKRHASRPIPRDNRLWSAE